MQPSNVDHLIAFAESVAMGHRETASYCSKGQEALQARFVQGAQTIDSLIENLKLATYMAQLNHDTILEMQREFSSQGGNVCRVPSQHAGALPGPDHAEA